MTTKKPAYAGFLLSSDGANGMEAVCLDNGSLVFLNDYPTPTPGRNQVLIKILLAGICGTDMALMRGYANFSGVPGHEFVGRVIALGEGVLDTWLNQRVVAEINQYCDDCMFCNNKQYEHCQQRRVIGIRDHQGAFAQYIVVNVKTLHRLPENITDEQAVFIEPLAAAYRIVDQLSSINYNDVLIIGAGKLGQLIARVFAQLDKDVTVLVKREQHAQLLHGLPLSIISNEKINQRKWDVVVEASGHHSGLSLALEVVQPMGHIVLKSSYDKQVDISLSALVVNEITLIGSRCGPFNKAIEALQDGRIDISPLINGRYSLQDIKQAMAHASTAGAMKVLLKPN